ASEDVSFDQAYTAVRAAVDAWITADCDGAPPRVELAETAPATGARHEHNNGRRTANIIFFGDREGEEDSRKRAITTDTFDADSGEIYDVDMAVNSTDYKFSTNGAPDTMDLLSVLTHETGHFLGLAHSGVPEATMNAGYSIDLRTLSEDDRAG